MKRTFVFAFALAAVTVVAEPVVSDVTVASQWPWSGKVKVSFSVSGVSSGKNAKFAFSAYDGAVKLCDVDSSAVSGDIYADQGGVCTVEIDPAALGPLATACGGLKDFRVGVEVTEVSPILYKVIDLQKAKGAANQIIYISADDLAAGNVGDLTALGATETNPVPGVSSIIWTGLTNSVATNSRYINARIVFRRIPAGTFNMGSSGILTTISKGFWIGVFPFTWGQFGFITDDNRASVKNNTLPASRLEMYALDLTWNMMRGDSSVWPEEGYVVETNSVCGLLANLTGQSGFDLPTEAQWEYACRASTTDNAKYRSDAELDELGSYTGNNGSLCRPGQYLPNAWGLYDMIGNVWERVLDWNGTPAGGTDPWGTSSGNYSQRIIRGGSYMSGAGNCSCISRTADSSTAPDSGGSIYGFRLVQNGCW